MYGLLLFGGPVSVDHVKGGLTVSARDGAIKLKAWPRIGVLVNQLRCVAVSQGVGCAEDLISHFCADGCWTCSSCVRSRRGRSWRRRGTTRC
jgi:hypothetical protein